MNATWQTPIALGIVILTILAFAWRTWRQRRNPGAGCGSGGCACPTGDLKAAARRAKTG